MKTISKEHKNKISKANKGRKRPDLIERNKKNTKKQFEEFITEEIIDIKTILMNKATIYNITLEGEDTFYANGILTHNTPPRLSKSKKNKGKKIKTKGQRPNPFIRGTLMFKFPKIVQEEILKSF